MDNSNYGYPPSDYTSSSSSTASNIRPYQSILGLSVPSTSKTIPNSFSDSLTYNFGKSTSRIDNFNYDVGTHSYNKPYKNDSSCNYFSEKNYFYPVQPSGNASMSSAAKFDTDFMAESSRIETWRSVRKFNKAYKRGMSALRARKCKICRMDFSSEIPYEMHLKSIKHAKKMQTSKCVVSQSGLVSDETLFCDLCNVQSNSVEQYEMHIQGKKHKKKLNPIEPYYV